MNSRLLKPKNYEYCSTKFTCFIDFLYNLLGVFAAFLDFISICIQHYSE